MISIMSLRIVSFCLNVTSSSKKFYSSIPQYLLHPSLSQLLSATLSLSQKNKTKNPQHDAANTSFHGGESLSKMKLGASLPTTHGNGNVSQKVQLHLILRAHLAFGMMQVILPMGFFQQRLSSGRYSRDPPT